jgi:hypothetical protein
VPILYGFFLTTRPFLCLGVCSLIKSLFAIQKKKCIVVVVAESAEKQF